MNRRIVKGVLAAAVALVLATAGRVTDSSPIAAADVGPNLVTGGVLQLRLDRGAESVPVSFTGLMPGGESRRLVWVAREDAGSTMPGTLAVSFASLDDVPGPCATSLDKARAEIDAGIGGCTITATGASGTPERGNLSRALAVDVAYAGGARDGCRATGPETSLLAPGVRPGDLRDAVRTARSFPVRDAGGPVVLTPGDGACLAVSASWPAGKAAGGVPDNAVHGDSLRVLLRVELTQA